MMTMMLRALREAVFPKGVPYFLLAFISIEIAAILTRALEAMIG